VFHQISKSRGEIMSDMEVQTAAEPGAQAPGLSQMQRVTSIFSAPSKTFEDIRRGNKSWWMPIVLMVVTFAVFYGVVSTKITWTAVYQSEQKSAPEFAKRMQEQAPPESRAAQEKMGPMIQAVTAGLAPVGILIIDLIAAAVLMATVNFGFGGKATFGSMFTVTLYAGLVLWPLRWLLAAIAAFFTDPEAFSIHNPAPTNIGAFMPELKTGSLVLYSFLTALDALSIWCMVVTAIGVASVAGVKRSSGYIIVFGWWFIGLLIGVGAAAAFS
jgi:hypothetical protein